MYENIIMGWFACSVLWWATIGLIGAANLENCEHYPFFISIWRCLAIGYWESKYDCNLLGKICITLLVAMLYLPVLPFFSIIGLIGFIFYKLFTLKPKKIK